MRVSLRKEMMKLGQNTWKELHFKPLFPSQGKADAASNFRWGWEKPKL